MRGASNSKESRRNRREIQRYLMRLKDHPSEHHVDSLARIAYYGKTGDILSSVNWTRIAFLVTPIQRPRLYELRLIVFRADRAELIMSVARCTFSAFAHGSS